MSSTGVPLPLVVSVVVFLLLVAALCGGIAIWTILRELRGRTPQVLAPSCMILASPVALPPPRPTPSLMGPRRTLPPGVPPLPPPLPRGSVLGTLMPERDDDDDDDHDYTVVDDGVTIVRGIRVTARR